MAKKKSKPVVPGKIDDSDRKKHATISQVAKLSGLPTSDVNKVFSSIILLVRRHGEVRINGFGKFTSRHYEKRTIGRMDRKTKELVDCEVKERTVLHFNSSSKANDALTANMGD